MKSTAQKSKTIPFVFYVLVSFMPLFASAQTDSIDQQYLREIKITELKLLRQRISPVPVQVLSGKQLQKLNSLSVADVIRFFSGVQLKDYGGIGGLKTINVRSLGTNHTAVFYDGVQLGNAQNGQVDLGKFSLDNIEEISLYNGQNPDLLQPAKAYASTGSLYLKTKEPEFLHGKIGIGLRIKSGSFGLFNPAVGFDYKISEKLSARVSAETMKANGRYRFRYTNGVFDTTAVRNNSDIDAYRVETGLYGRPDSSTKWSVKMYHYQSQRGLPRAIVSNRFNANQRLWDDNTFVQASFTKQFSARYSLLALAKYANDYNRYLDPELTTTDGFLNNKYKQKEAYLSLANQYKLSPVWQLSLSADYLYNTLDANIYRFAYPSRNTVLVNFLSQWYFKRVNVQAGVLSSTIKENTKELEAGNDQQKFTPTLMFNLQPITKSGLRLRGFYKSVFRMPTFNDLYYTFVGNSFLKPESATQYDLGLIWSSAPISGFFQSIDLQADAYYNTVRNKIVAVPGANLFRWSMINLDKVHIKGIDAGFKITGKLSDKIPVTAGLNYTYQQALDVTPGANTFNQQIPYTPKHSGSFIASAGYKEFGINYSFIYTGERYSQKANIPVNYVEPWYTHDVSLQYGFNLNRHRFDVTAEVNNLLNQYYDVILNFPMPGRNYRLTLSYKI